MTRSLRHMAKRNREGQRMLCRDCFSEVLPVGGSRFTCEACHLLLYKEELIVGQAAKDIAGLLELCRQRGGRPLRETVWEAMGRVARRRGVLRQTVYEACTRRIGLTGPGSMDRFVAMVREVLRGGRARETTG